MDTSENNTGVTAGGLNSSSPLSEDWIIGFIEAEGSFTQDKTEYNTYPTFCMTQRNSKILERILNKLQVDSKVYECKDHFPRLSFRGEDKILSMIKFLDGRLHTKYSKQRFKKWKKTYCAAYGTPAALGDDDR